MKGTGGLVGSSALMSLCCSLVPLGMVTLSSPGALAGLGGRVRLMVLSLWLGGGEEESVLLARLPAGLDCTLTAFSCQLEKLIIS